MTPNLTRISLFGFDPFSDVFGTGASINTKTPACDVRKTDEDRYSITLAVPGFSQHQLRISTQNGRLAVSGELAADDDTTFVHREIPRGSFERSFQLADYVSVAGAELKDGLLRIDLVREVPDELKPRRIEIKSGQPQRLIESNDNRGQAA